MSKELFFHLLQKWINMFSSNPQKQGDNNLITSH